MHEQTGAVPFGGSPLLRIEKALSGKAFLPESAWRAADRSEMLPDPLFDNGFVARLHEGMIAMLGDR